jgi:hypothetical protein
MSKQFTYGIRGLIPDDVAQTRIIPFCVLPGTRDRHHTRIDPASCDTRNYKKNPIVLYAHNETSIFGDPDPDMVIGKTTDLFMMKKELHAHIEFEPATINPLAEKIFNKILFGSLNMTSVGFMEKSAGFWGPGEEQMGGKNETYYLGNTELLEISIVNLPSNPESGKRTLSSQPKGSIKYAESSVRGRLSDYKLHKLTIEDLLALLEIWSINPDSDIKDPARAKQALLEREQRLQQLKDEKLKYEHEEKARKAEFEKEQIRAEEARFRRERIEYLVKREQEKNEKKDPWFIS